MTSQTPDIDALKGILGYLEARFPNHPSGKALASAIECLQQRADVEGLAFQLYCWHREDHGGGQKDHARAWQIVGKIEGHDKYLNRAQAIASHIGAQHSGNQSLAADILAMTKDCAGVPQNPDSLIQMIEARCFAEVPDNPQDIGAQDRWREIESAPKNGDSVLLWATAAGEISGPSEVAAMSIGFYSGPGDYPEYEWMEDGGDAYAVWLNPTHWMPLPAEPQETDHG